jgi:hypothetical protein
VLHRQLTAPIQRLPGGVADVAAAAVIFVMPCCNLTSIPVRVGENLANFPDLSSVAPVRRVNAAVKAATQNKNSNSQNWTGTCSRAIGKTSRRKMIVSARHRWSSACKTAVLRPASTTVWAGSPTSRTMSGTLPEFSPKTDRLQNLP